MIVEKYDLSHKKVWDDFIGSSKNGMFLFCRDYMDYHADRFHDNSLLFTDERDGLVAVMPANISGHVLVSHGGLTFGGIVSSTRMTTPRMLDIFTSLAGYLEQEGITALRYKTIPHIYHTVPAEEDAYALFTHHAQLVRREVSSAIYMPARLGFSKGRKHSIGKARKAGLQVRQSDDYVTFIGIAEEVLTRKYSTKPTHTAAEIAMLAGRFPLNIRLFAAFGGEEMLAGAIMYVSRNVAHVQYMGSSDKGKEMGALDLVISEMIENHFSGARFFSFGISTEQQGRYLNCGLIAQKEMFGARAVVFDTYEMKIAQGKVCHEFS